MVDVLGSDPHRNTAVDVQRLVRDRPRAIMSSFVGLGRQLVADVSKNTHNTRPYRHICATSTQRASRPYCRICASWFGGSCRSIQSAIMSAAVSWRRRSSSPFALSPRIRSRCSWIDWDRRCNRITIHRDAATSPVPLVGAGLSLASSLPGSVRQVVQLPGDSARGSEEQAQRLSVGRPRPRRFAPTC